MLAAFKEIDLLWEVSIKWTQTLNPFGKTGLAGWRPNQTVNRRVGYPKTPYEDIHSAPQSNKRIAQPEVTKGLDKCNTQEAT